MKVALYARVSTDDKEQNPEVQILKCQQYCELNNHKIIAEFKEEGVSGDTLIWERPEGLKLKELIDAGKVEALIVFSVDRFSRQSPLKVLNQIQYLKEIGVKFVSVSEPPFNMESEYAEPFRYMLTWFFNWFLVQHKKKVMAGIERAKLKGTKSGKPIGRARLSGWHRNRILEARAQGKSIRQIAKDLGLSVGVVHKTITQGAGETNPPKTECSQGKSIMNGEVK